MEPRDRLPASGLDGIPDLEEVHHINSTLTRQNSTLEGNRNSTYAPSRESTDYRFAQTTFKNVNIFFTIVGISLISFTYFNIGFQNLVILCYVELT